MRQRSSYQTTTDHLPLYRQEKIFGRARPDHRPLDTGAVGRTNRRAAPAAGRCPARSRAAPTRDPRCGFHADSDTHSTHIRTVAPSACRGDMVVVRYADDSVVGFRKQWQAQQFLVQLQERLARFDLSLNAAKTRLIEFGRFAIGKRRRRALGKPETFDFLGFTHCCSTKRNGDFQVLRLTVKKRMRATLLAIRDELQRRRHEPVRVQGQWLNRGGLFQLPRGVGQPAPP